MPKNMDLSNCNMAYSDTAVCTVLEVSSLHGKLVGSKQKIGMEDIDCEKNLIDLTSIRCHCTVYIRLISIINLMRY